MWNTLLLAVLSFALLVECVMTAAGFFVPTMMLEKFQIVADHGTLFLGHVIAWFLLLVDGMILYAILAIRRRDPHGWTMTRFLSGWWVLLGISIYIFFGKPDNLFLDSLKGVVLLVAAHQSQPKQPNL